MLEQGNHKHTFLIENLIQLLQNLNFTHIRKKRSTKDQHKGDSNYIPPLSAKKNEVEYYFEFIVGKDPEPDDLKACLNHRDQEIGEGWDIALVLVTQYGNKEKVKGLADQLNLSYDYIWEI
ncbi:hypothetical protein NC796_19075 [Aliifodinibius sp. S!AR15-10]|uniref:hypothetical protein n=1 Tax=Aliifodinibius sp. S!AR15-10 TaxID=2950437 RepID=UPI002862443D|nr:hypothetical protein [Aliifodinibius sp. S!AR15-10]MDR8393265.1 hypothetical protein [Aliifodinibius sp. S!AR15-10]